MRVLMIYFNTAARASFPLGLSTLANYIKGKGHDVEIFDTTFYKEFAKNKRDNIREKFGFYKKIQNPIEIKYQESSITDDLKKKIDEFRPGIIGFSILSAQFQYSMTIAKFIKQSYHSIPIIVGGLHPTLLPDETINNPCVDMICIGEGEYPFEELLSKMEDKKDITSINGIWVKQNGKVFKNAMGQITDMVDLPVNDWDFFSSQHLYSPLDGKMYHIGPVEFSRGCPYSCAYCSVNAMRDMVRPQKYLRRKSVDGIIEELVHLRNKYKIDMFYFLDETFLSSDLVSLRIFAEEYKKHVDIPFYGLTHPLSVSDEKVKLLKMMGCYLMTIGIECGNEDFRRNILNRNVPTKRIIEAFETFRRHGIHASGFAMLGLPFETRELVFDTIELFRKCQPRTYAVGIYKPFLGSPLRDVCIKEGFFDPGDDNYVYPDYESVLTMPQFPNEEIAGLYKTFFLYTKVPQDKYPQVKEAERDDKIFAELVSEFRMGN